METMTKNQIASGKGLTRVQIAQKVVDKLTAQLAAATARLNQAIADEENRAGNQKEREGRKRERAIAAIVSIGKTRKEAIEILGFQQNLL